MAEKKYCRYCAYCICGDCYQKAEISKLKSDQYAIDKFARDLCKERMLKGKAIADFEDLQDYIKKEKTEAIRKFSLTLIRRIHELDDYACDIGYGRQEQGYLANEVVATIDSLVKEMTEGKMAEYKPCLTCYHMEADDDKQKA